MHKMKTILVVDDEPDICLALTNVLEHNGFVVH
jgi:CheY-like chemotaxis protein